MKGEQRREEIISRLRGSSAPVSAGSLSQEFGVSRQIIVKDISILRNNGYAITALARGYILEKKLRAEKVFKVIHSDDDVQKELELIVDLGGIVEDVFVYHKAYNKVRADMGIETRADVLRFLENIKTGKSSLLKNVTSGYHYHTVSAADEKTLEIIENELWKTGFLAPLQEHEPSEINTQNQKEN